MLGRDSCGCVYLVAGDAVFCVSACDSEGDPWVFSYGWRANSQHAAGEPRELEPIEGEKARNVFASWGDLISDGYRGRDLIRSIDSLRRGSR